MGKRGLVVLSFLMAMFSSQASAQPKYVFCFASENPYSAIYFSSVFSVSSPIHVDTPQSGADGRIGTVSSDTGNDIAVAFKKYLVEHSRIVPAGVTCDVYTSIGGANEGISGWKEEFRSIHPIRDIAWIYVPLKQGTQTGATKATEAEALYDAENFPGPFEDNQYKTIHSWDTHECTTKQVTGVAGSSKPTTFYQCTVTFSYSDTASPVAKTAFGKGDTQDAAIAAAKSSANTVLLTGITWGQPLCSSYYTTVKNPYKADYGHSAGTKKENWACEVDFTGNK